MLGELNFFLGLQVVQKKDGIQIHQQKYVSDILRKYSMDQVKSFPTPLSITSKKDFDPDSKKVNETIYRGMIGSLMYLMASRPDILFATSLCARFQSDPRECHLTMVKRIFRYLKGTTNLCLYYSKFSNFDVLGYTDCFIYHGGRVYRCSGMLRSTTLAQATVRRFSNQATCDGD